MQQLLLLKESGLALLRLGEDSADPGVALVTLTCKDRESRSRVANLMRNATEDQRKSFHALFVRHLGEILSCKDTTTGDFFADGYTASNAPSLCQAGST